MRSLPWTDFTMKVVNEELDATQMSKAAESLSDTTAAQLKATLHQSKYVLLKEENLTQSSN